MHCFSTAGAAGEETQQWPTEDAQSKKLDNRRVIFVLVKALSASINLPVTDFLSQIFYPSLFICSNSKGSSSDSAGIVVLEVTVLQCRSVSLNSANINRRGIQITYKKAHARVLSSASRAVQNLLSCTACADWSRVRLNLSTNIIPVSHLFFHTALPRTVCGNEIQQKQYQYCTASWILMFSNFQMPM